MSVRGNSENRKKKPCRWKEQRLPFLFHHKWLCCSGKSSSWISLFGWFGHSCRCSSRSLRAADFPPRRKKKANEKKKPLELSSAMSSHKQHDQSLANEVLTYCVTWLSVTPQLIGMTFPSHGPLLACTNETKSRWNFLFWLQDFFFSWAAHCCSCLPACSPGKANKQLFTCCLVLFLQGNYYQVWLVMPVAD